MLGTTVGFVVGALVLELVGTEHAVLWAVFPVGVFIAAFAPEAISFAAGQAAFTVVVVILFNLIDPAGWRIGITRVEDVAVGAGVSLVVGLLVWPRGASAAVVRALDTALRTASGHLVGAVRYITGALPEPPGDDRAVLAAARTLDDAMRHLQVEVGNDRRRLATVAADADDATRVRLAADAVLALGGDPDATARRSTPARQALLAHTDRLAAAVGRPAEADHPTAEPDSGTDALTDVLDRLTDEPDDIGEARRLLWAAMYVSHLERRR